MRLKSSLLMACGMCGLLGFDWMLRLSGLRHFVV